MTSDSDINRLVDHAFSVQAHKCDCPPSLHIHVLDYNAPFLTKKDKVLFHRGVLLKLKPKPEDLWEEIADPAIRLPYIEALLPYLIREDVLTIEEGQLDLVLPIFVWDDICKRLDLRSIIHLGRTCRTFYHFITRPELGKDHPKAFKLRHYLLLRIDALNAQDFRERKWKHYRNSAQPILQIKELMHPTAKKARLDFAKGLIFNRYLHANFLNEFGQRSYFVLGQMMNVANQLKRGIGPGPKHITVDTVLDSAIAFPEQWIDTTLSFIFLRMNKTKRECFLVWFLLSTCEPVAALRRTNKKHILKYVQHDVPKWSTPKIVAACAELSDPDSQMTDSYLPSLVYEIMHHGSVDRDLDKTCPEAVQKLKSIVENRLKREPALVGQELEYLAHFAPLLGLPTDTLAGPYYRTLAKCPVGPMPIKALLNNLLHEEWTEPMGQAILTCLASYVRHEEYEQGMISGLRNLKGFSPNSWKTISAKSCNPLPVCHKATKIRDLIKQLAPADAKLLLTELKLND